jgi:hypothetical protein
MFVSFSPGIVNYEEELAVAGLATGLLMSELNSMPHFPVAPPGASLLNKKSNEGGAD